VPSNAQRFSDIAGARLRDRTSQWRNAAITIIAQANLPLTLKLLIFRKQYNIENSVEN